MEKSGRGRLVVSLSGVVGGCPDTRAAVVGELDRRGVPLSLLVTPRPVPRPDTVDWLRERRALGDAVVMHGVDHQETPLGNWLSGVNANGTLAGVGWRRAEFAALPAHEAGLRLAAGRSIMDRLGLSTTAFAPPRWFASPGTIAALPRHGFTTCADSTGVRDLGSHGGLAARVIGFRRARTGFWSARSAVTAAGRIARRGGLVRLTVDTRDLRHDGAGEALLAAVDLALAHGATPLTYPRLSRPTVVPLAG